MKIDIIYDSSVTATGGPNPCPTAAFEACVQGVANFYETQFTNNVTITWDVGWGEVDGMAIPGGAGAESLSNYTTNNFTYSQIKTAFASHDSDADEASALASLPSTDPTPGGASTFNMTTAEAKALGVFVAGDDTGDPNNGGATTTIDGWSGLDSTSTWIFNTTNTNGANVPAGDSDAFSFLAHELSEVMGRQMDFASNNDGNGYYPYDLFDYTPNGVRSFTASAADRYFSVDGGKTNTGLHYFNNVAANGDLFDTIPNGTKGSYEPNGPLGPDSYDYEGTIGAVSPNDLRLMDVLGYDPTTKFTWANQISDVFTNPEDWTAGVVPIAADAAVLDAPGKTAYIVTSSGSQTVASIQTASTATLSITGGVFDATGGTGGGSNAGVIEVGSGATFEVGGTFDNAAKTLLKGGSELLVAAGGLTLSGTGELEMDQAARSEITVVAAGATLTNVSEHIEGGGEILNGNLTLVNETAGVIASVGADNLTITTGGHTIVNAGLLLSSGAGGLTIDSPVDNTGHLTAGGGTLTVTGAVTGSGYAEVATGTLLFDSSFNGNVVFTSASNGSLELEDSKGYTTGQISGLSKTGANSLDLLDVPFAGVTTGHYSGTATSGVLTVTEGANVATIHLLGDYLGSAFVLSSGSGGGTKVVDPSAASAIPGAAPTKALFVQALAAFESSKGLGDFGPTYGHSGALLVTPVLAHAS